MSRAVLDSSILIALVKDERYEGSIVDLLPNSIISAVNLAEVLTKVSDLGLSQTAEVESLLRLLRGVEPFTAKQALVTAELRSRTKHAGLSLGDRACLSLAIERGLPAYTLDRNWMRVHVGCSIHCLR